MRFYFFLLPLVSAVSLFGESKKPNFILFLSDDQGWNQTSVPMIDGLKESASSRVKTPALERLAKQGMIFSQAYAPHCMCGPTRHALQFGKAPAGMGIQGQQMEKIPEESTAFMNVLKKADSDYKGAHFGKWNMRMEPTALGYDDSDGMLSNQHGNSDDPHDPKWIFWLGKRANHFMGECVKEDRPFYLQISHFAVHPAPQAKEGSIAEIQKRGLASGREVTIDAMVEDLDDGLDLVLKEIDRLGIADNTYFIFSSDNGEAAGFGRSAQGSNILQGGKGNLLERGIRVPFIVRGPGIEPGSRSDVATVGHDLLPTILDIVAPGKSVPSGWEGGSLKEVLHSKGEGTVERQMPYFVWHVPRIEVGSVEEAHSSILMGELKATYYWKTKKSTLHKVATDISEKEDLAEKHPEDLEKLTGLLQSYLEKGLPDGQLSALKTNGEVQAGGSGGRGRSGGQSGGRPGGQGQGQSQGGGGRPQRGGDR